MKSLIILLLCAATSIMASGCGDKSRAAAQPEGALSMSSGDVDLAWGPCPPIFPSGCEMAVLHGDPAGSNADIFLRVPAGYEIPPHSHTSAERMILVTGKLTVSYLGQAPATLSTGDYAFGPATKPHKAVCESDAPCTLFIAFESPVDANAYSGDL